MDKPKIFNKSIFKKWWFWAMVLAIVILASTASGDSSNQTDGAANTSTAETKGTLPQVTAADYMGEEGLIAFKELSDKKYSVTAKYENEKAPGANQDHTEQFKNASVTSCSDRLGWDAYVVSGVSQDGDNIIITTTVKGNSNQECPEGTVNDL